MAQVILALGVLLDIFPFEISAAAAGEMSAGTDVKSKARDLPAPFFANSLYEIHGGSVVELAW